MRRDKQAKEKARANAESGVVEQAPKPVVKHAPLPTAVLNLNVTQDEAGMRVDRFLEHRSAISSASRGRASCA